MNEYLISVWSLNAPVWPCSTQTHPDLRLWCQPWKRAERPWRRDGSGTGTDTAPSPAPTDEGSERDHKSLARGGAEALMSAAMEKLSRASSSAFSPYQSFQDSYIMSEHCYQKPRAYYPAVEQRLVVETTRRGSELEDSLRSTENLLELEQRYGGPLDPDRAKLYPSSLLQDRAKIHPITLQPDKVCTLSLK